MPAPPVKPAPPAPPAPHQTGRQTGPAPRQSGSRILTYREAGVDIEAKEEILAGVRARIRATYGAGALDAGDGFGGLFRLTGYRDPVIVSSIDGVGTKTRLALWSGRPRQAGTDIVAHGANDVLCQGAAPLFMLDYVASAALDPAVVSEVIEGIADACVAQGIALLGGETAEMPGVYARRELDIVGCTVGAVERDDVITGARIRPGDAVIGLGSDGLHTNGYTLARAVLLPRGSREAIRRALARKLPGLGETVGEALLRPHRPYARPVLALRRHLALHGVAHVTGGGLPGNLVRILPDGCHAALVRGRWPVPPIFTVIQRRGRIADDEMFRTFNMGLGLVLVVPRASAAAAVRLLETAGERAWVVGEITSGIRGVEIRA
ncbi:MAG TPA: phosphoribosylformylglycinamidine cyclo-ligase [bacterium]|nr:phosphoribosylformylglycinamidine cyclo-ligase [bacterium]